MSAQAMPQHMAALAKGNAIRLEAAGIRRELAQLDSADSLMRAAELVLDPPEALRTMRLGHFLRGIRRVNTVRMQSFLRAAEIPLSFEDRVLGPVKFNSDHKGLSDRQREALADVLATISVGMR